MKSNNADEVANTGNKWREWFGCVRLLCHTLWRMLYDLRFFNETMKIKDNYLGFLIWFQYDAVYQPFREMRINQSISIDEMHVEDSLLNT